MRRVLFAGSSGMNNRDGEPPVIPRPFSVGLEAPAPGYKLERVIILIRHGLRTPLDKFTDAVWDCAQDRSLNLLVHEERHLPVEANELYRIHPVIYDRDMGGSCLPGQLTRKGFAQHVSLGELLRERYVNSGFLPEEFRRNAGTIHTRSTDYPRTIASAQALLSGLYPPSKRASGEMGQMGLHVRHGSNESLYPRPFDCPPLKILQKRLLKSAAEEHNVRTERRGDHALPSSYMITTLETLILHGHESIGDYQSVAESAAREHGKVFAEPKYARLAGGVLAHEIEEMIQSETGSKIQLLSGHDTSHLPLLGVLGAVSFGEPLSHPPCGSSLIFEVWTKSESLPNAQPSRMVRLLFNGEPLALAAVEQTIENSGFYSWDRLGARIRQFALSADQWRAQCAQTDANKTFSYLD